MNFKKILIPLSVLVLAGCTQTQTKENTTNTPKLQNHLLTHKNM